MLAELDGSCRTPIGGHARLLPDGALQLTGLVARADGGFLLRRTLAGPPADGRAARRRAGRACAPTALRTSLPEQPAPVRRW